MLLYFTNSSELSKRAQVIFMKILTLYMKKTPQTKLSHSHISKIKAAYFILTSTMSLKKPGLSMLSKPKMYKFFWRGHSALSKTKTF